MRVYKICIYKQEDLKDPIVTFKQDFNVNPLKATVTGLDINFDIEIGETISSSKYILQIHNVDYFFNNMNSQELLYGRYIEIFGGLAQNPVTKCLGLKCKSEYEIFSAPLFTGFIANAIPTMEGTGNVLRLLISPMPTFNKLEKVDLAFKKKTAVGSFIIKAIKDLTGLNTVIEQKIADKQVQNVTIVCPNLDTIKNYVEKKLKTTFYIFRGTVYIGSDPYNLNAQKPIHKIEASNLLGQPEMTNPWTISFNTFLTNNYNIHDTITIPENLFLGIQSFSSIDDAYANDVNAFLHDNKYGNNKSFFTMFSGSYIITKIWHRASLRSADSESWSTAIQAVSLDYYNRPKK